MTAVEDLPVVPGGWDTAVPIRRGWVFWTTITLGLEPGSKKDAVLDNMT